jgi:putative redox protein
MLAAGRPTTVDRDVASLPGHPGRTPIRHERVTFTNDRGHRLAGRIDYPLTREPVGFAIYAHCFTCTKNLRAVGRITETLALHGLATLRFDFTGLGDSEGDFPATNFSTNVADLVAAAAFLAEEYEAPEVLIGHSMGGTVVLDAAARIPSARAVVTIAAPASPDHVKRHFADDVDRIERHGEAEVLLAGRPFTIRDQFLADVDRVELETAIRGLRRPLLVLHSPIDNTVGVDNAAAILDLAKHPKSYVSLDDADHLISDDADARYAAEMIATWADRYLSRSLISHAQHDFVSDAPRSVTTVRIEDGLRAAVISNGFPLVADEPESAGGTNTGPTPYDYLLTALGSCTAMTLRMYADRKGWPLGTVTVCLTHRKVHARDSNVAESANGYIDEIERSLELTGDLDAGQRARLIEIADRCPVHKTLHGQVVVVNGVDRE